MQARNFPSQPASSSLSSASFSAKAFAVYLFIVGAVLVLAPNVLLSLFGFTTLAILKLASPMLAPFGVVDLLGGLWPFLALKRDAQPDSVHWLEAFSS